MTAWLISCCVLQLDFRMQTLIRVECCARMRRETPCRTFREWDASRRGAAIGQREVRNRSGRWACGMACGNNTDYVRFFGRRRASVATRALASGATRNGRRARDAGRSYRWLPVCLSFGRPPLLGARGSGGHRSHGGAPTQKPQCRFRPLGRRNMRRGHFSWLMNSSSLMIPAIRRSCWAIQWRVTGHRSVS